jgi:hypothetical protein
VLLTFERMCSLNALSNFTVHLFCIIVVTSTDGNTGLRLCPRTAAAGQVLLTFEGRNLGWTGAVADAVCKDAPINLSQERLSCFLKPGR